MLHSLIPASVTSRFLNLSFSCSEFQRAALKVCCQKGWRIPVVRCGSYVQTAKLCVDVLQKFFPKPHQGYQGRHRWHLPWQVCDRRDGALQWVGEGWLISCRHQWNVWNSAAQFWSLGCLCLCWILTEIAADSCLSVELLLSTLGKAGV